MKDAIATAKTYVQDIYPESEQVSEVTLEEVEFDPAKQEWLITVEFSRPFKIALRTRMSAMIEAGGGEPLPKRRVQKVVVISDRDKRAIAMRNREAA